MRKSSFAQASGSMLQAHVHTFVEELTWIGVFVWQTCGRHNALQACARGVTGKE